MAQTSSTEIDVVRAARQLKVELSRSFPDTGFSIRTSRFSMGEAIHVEWTDGPTEGMVEAISSAYKDIDRDAFGDILGGGNRYVDCTRRLSPVALAWARGEAAKVGGDPDQVHRLLRRTRFDAQGTPYAVEL